MGKMKNSRKGTRVTGGGRGKDGKRGNVKGEKNGIVTS